ncbi:MAG: inorganic phosphate transporter [Desulfobacteraceae bacterium]|nr:inorganic phosphate transporter [Desulfobacteraceae bacterium]
MEAIIFAMLGSGAYVAWNIGASDTANCIGTTVGCGLISYRKAVIIVAVFSLAGTLLQGDQVMKTIGKGIVKENLEYLAILVVLICSGFFVTLATFFKIPVSTSQAIVGGVLGIGLALDAQIEYSKLITIAQSWLICPVLAMALAYGLHQLLILLLKRLNINPLLVQNTIGKLAILSVCYVAFAMGACNAGNAVGFIANLNIIHPKLLLLISGMFISLGAITYGKKVSGTVGKGITPLDLSGAFIAQMSAAFGMHLFSLLGIPVSTTSAIVGAVVGVGLVKGTSAIKKKTIFIILVGWLLTPACAAGTAFFIYRGLNYILS